jgi:glycosyltransferase involved in cell wall biosynthesis
MACGAPVITSNTSSMPEIAGDAACIVDPFKTEELTAAMIRLTNDEIARNELIKRGIPQAAKFSWRSMAEHVLTIYNEVNNQSF